MDLFASYLAESRFGYGPKGGRLSSSGDGRDYVLSQLRASADAPEFIGLKSGAAILPSIEELRQQIKEMKSEEEANKDALKSLRDEYVAYYLAEVDAHFRLIATSDTPFMERLAWFWSNHFTVSGEKHITVPLLGAYEREALRPRITGTFSDLLKAAIQHPAMILYLDNQTSISPEFGEERRARRAQRGMDAAKGPSGINENLAREIMELHTLGVGSGYTQTDVTAFAHVLTGWSVYLGDNLIKHMDAGSDNSTGFGFAPVLHDNSEQVILGKTYGQDGILQGEAVLNDLAHHPATAKHISYKLAQHFIADEPPNSLVERMSMTFMNTGGHLPSVYQTLVESDEAWQPPLLKSKTAVEYVASSLRIFPDAPQDPKKIVGMLNQMGQKPWFAPSPQGWPDTVARWFTPDGLWKRVEWAEKIGEKVQGKIDARALAQSMFGPLLSNNTATGIAQAESGSQAMALLLLSPEFQRR